MHLLSTHATKIVATALFVVILAVVLLAIPQVAAQQGPPPHFFLGQATLNGVPARVGTVITALADGQEVDTVTIDTPGQYSGIEVPEAGKTITYKIGTHLADQTATSEVGGATILDLTATSSSFVRSVVSQSQILHDLFFETNGANWRNRGNWLSREPLGNWVGVSTSPGGVTELRLGDNNLKGKIPAQMGGLSTLTHLDLRGGGRYSNELVGPIPPELGNLLNLTHLDLSNNQLNGRIPAVLGNLTQLTHLDLSNNGLTGTISADLGKLSNLVYLDLTGNKLTGTIPSSLGNLKDSIETLRIQNAGLVLQRRVVW